MKRKTTKRIMAGFWALAVAVMSSMTALAADTVDVNGSGKYADSTDIVVGYQDQDLFSNMKNLMPGDQVENQVTVSNKSGRSVNMYLKAYSNFTSADGKTAVRDKSTASADGKTFRDDILNQISMTLKLGDKILYSGSADGEKPDAGYEAMTAGDYGIRMGSFASGQQETLSVTLTLPGPEFDNQFVNKFDAVDWVFCVEGTSPSTGGGDDTDNGGGGGNDGGGGGNNGGNGGNNPGDNPIEPGPGAGLVEIGDAPVPLAPWTGVEETPNIIILDPEVPLASIPKMGDTGVSGYVFGILFVLLIACGALYVRKRYGQPEKTSGNR